MNSDERAQAVYRQMLPMVMSRGNFVAIIADAIHEAEQAARAAALEEAAAVCDGRADQQFFKEFHPAFGGGSYDKSDVLAEVEDCAEAIRALQRAAPAERIGE